jgi:hypothetical protein
MRQFNFRKMSVIALGLVLFWSLLLVMGCVSTATETRGEEGSCIGLGKRYLVGAPSQCGLKDD